MRGAEGPHRWPARLAWAGTILCLAMVAASLPLTYLDRAAIYSFNTDFSTLFPAVMFGILGGFVASRRPQNPIGWLMLTIGLGTGLGSLTLMVALRALLTGTSPDGWVEWPALLYNLNNVAVGALGLVLLLFPDGTVLSRRWRWAIWLTIATTILFAAGNLFDAAPVKLAPHLPGVRNPLGLDLFRGSRDGPLFLLFLLIFILGLISLILRLRRSSGDERQQLKWFVYAVCLSVGLFIVAIPISIAFPTVADALLNVAFSFGFAVAVPGAAALAVLKYGLYDVDVVINKTIVYFSLAAVITAIYVAIVVGIGAIFGSRGNLGLSVLATAVVAVAFQPMRERTRRFANRLVYGKRATPYEVLSEFADGMAATYSLDDVLPRTAQVVAEATGAVRADVWLREGSELHAAGSWPSDPATERVPLPDPEAPAIPGASQVAAVRHQRELLGALSLEKSAGDPLTPAEEKLVADVASQAGLMLRNVRLVEDLRASRQRIVTAQDAERRRLERNIHDGAQQQLVALAVKQRLVGGFVKKDPDKAMELLRQLQADTADALENLRDLARGIYPPLLADQGLAAALESQARKAAIPTTVESDGLGRYPQDAEAAVYFCALEALQNAAKYAEATSAWVELSDGDGWLRFAVRDDGIGFDMASKAHGTGIQGMRDRLAALGGELTVTSGAASGTSIEGRLPVADAAHAGHVGVP